jgi:hypothetical protein
MLCRRKAKVTILIDGSFDHPRATSESIPRIYDYPKAQVTGGILEP